MSKFTIKAFNTFVPLMVTVVLMTVPVSSISAVDDEYAAHQQYVRETSPAELVCRAIREKLELEIEIIDDEGKRWIEVVAPYALGYDCYGRLMLVAVRGGSPEGIRCSTCTGQPPRWFQDAHGHAVAVGEVASIYAWNIHSVTIRDNWRFRPVPNAQEAIDERVCGWECRIH